MIKDCGYYGNFRLWLIALMLLVNLLGERREADLYAQSALRVQQYPISDKISQSKISQFLQDDNGFIWFGTWDGLVRFDGRYTQVFKTYPGDLVRIENQRIMNLDLSSTGNLWFTTYGSYCYFFDTHRNCFRHPLSKVGNKVRQTYVMKDGVAWFVKDGGGLYRVQEVGEDFKVDSITLPFDYNQLNLAVKDDAGNEWILTDKGAWIWNKDLRVGELPFEFFAENEGQIYLATREQVYTFESENGRCESLDLLLSGNVRDLKSLSGGGLLVVQWGGATICRNPLEAGAKGFDKISYHRFGTPIMRCALEDREHRLWFLGTEGQVYILDNNQLRKIPYIGQPATNVTSSDQLVMQDDYGTVWVQPGDRFPLAYYNPKKDRLEQAYTYQDGLRRPVNFYMRNGLVDQQHNFWGNIDEVGFCYLSFSRQEFDFLDDGHATMKASDLGARALMIDHRHRLWAGWLNDSNSEGGGLAIYDRNRRLLGFVSKSGSIVDDPNLSIPYNIYSLYEDSRHRIWVGTRYHGIYLLEPTSEEAVSFSVSHYEHLGRARTTRNGTSVYDILEDHNGRIWLACYGEGLYYVDGSSISNGVKLQFNQFKELGSDFDQCRCLFESSDGLLWLGTTQGLLTIDSSKPAVLSVNRCKDNLHSLSSSNVMDISSYHDGSLMISTFGGGVNLLKAGYTVSDSLQFEHYDARHGNYPDVVYAVLEDADSCIWLMTENGLMKYSSRLRKRDIFLQETPCTEANPVFDSEEEILYLGTRYDVLCFFHKDHVQSSYQPQIAFTSVLIHSTDSSTVMPLTPADSLLQFQANDRNFTISFLALDYADPQKIQYVYRLVDKHSQWIPLGNLPAVHIVDLPGGHYELEVRSTNADGAWCDNATRLQFYIEPYFYETLWFRLLMWFLILALAGYLLYYVLRRFERRRIKAMENRFAETKVRFFADMTQKRSPEDEEFIKTLMNYIEDKMLLGDFNVEQIAAATGLSYPVFYRKLKDVMDVTPVELVRQMRIQRAQRLLRETDLSVSEIAYQCGYSTPQYFNRVFKEQLRMTPVEFRKKELSE